LKIFTSGNYSKFYIFRAVREKEITVVAVGFGTVGNRVYRKMWQNLVDKIFGVPSLAEMSAIMAHSVVSAESSYLNNYAYSPSEKIKVLEELKAQLAASARP